METEQDITLLSAYIDGELTQAEKAALEARLQAEPALRDELASLRQTVEWVRQMPLLKAPRSYALDPARFAPPPKVMRPRWQVWMPALAAVFTLIIVGAVLVLSSGKSEQTSLVDRQEAAEAQPTASPVTEVAQGVMVPTQAAQTEIGITAANEAASEPATTLLPPTTQDIALQSTVAPQPTQIAGSEGETAAFAPAPSSAEASTPTPVDVDAAMAAGAPPSADNITFPTATPAAEMMIAESAPADSDDGLDAMSAPAEEFEDDAAQRNIPMFDVVANYLSWLLDFLGF